MEELKKAFYEVMYVFLARVLEEKRFKEIAQELGMGEKGVAAIYYRTVKKLRDTLERGE